MGEFPSGQRGQTVNLLSVTSVVRIHPRPPNRMDTKVSIRFLFVYGFAFLKENIKTFREQERGFRLNLSGENSALFIYPREVRIGSM